MKKFFVVLSALVCFSFGTAFAKDITASHGSWALGLQGGYVVNGAAGLSVTFKVPKAPLVFAADLGFNSDYFSVGATGDYWLANPNITGPLYWYYGPGLAASVSLDDDLGIFAGARFVVGLNVFPIQPLEIYLQAAGQIGVYIDDGVGLGWGVPVNLGIRWWF